MTKCLYITLAFLHTIFPVIEKAFLKERLREKLFYVQTKLCSLSLLPVCSTYSHPFLKVTIKSINLWEERSVGGTLKKNQETKSPLPSPSKNSICKLVLTHVLGKNKERFSPFRISFEYGYKTSIGSDKQPLFGVLRSPTEGRHRDWTLENVIYLHFTEEGASS